MEVRAIILVGGLGEAAAGDREYFAGSPLPAYEVLGTTVVSRVVSHLQAQGVSAVSLLSETPLAGLPPSVTQNTAAPGVSFWRAAENAFTEIAQSGAEVVLLLRLGGYAEFDVDEFIQRHLDAHTHVTRAVDTAGTSLDMFVITGSRRNDAAYLLRHRLQQTRSPAGHWVHRGYFNPLADARDLRRLAVDALLQRVQMKPTGREVRPGIWVGRGAHIDARARVIAPAFIGDHARIRAAAVVTRCGVIEHHAEVDSGTVIENSTVLPYTYVGPGLDVTHAVAGSRRLVHLPRSVEVEITDPKLMDVRPHWAPLRAASSAASLASFLPVQFFRGLFATSHRAQPKDLPAAINKPSTAIKTPAGFEGADPSAFPTNFAVARRYGDQ